MKNIKLKLAIVSALGLTASHVFATGFVALPNTGFTVSGGTSAYTLCNTTGDFGSGIPSNPTTSTNNTCAVFPTTENRSPGNSADYTGARVFPVAGSTNSIIVNNTYTGGVNKSIGNYRDYVWRSDDNSECIYGVKIELNSTDYNVAAGTQNFEVNDVARGGWSGLNVSAAYSTIPSIASPVYRIGLTYTAVQHRPGDDDQPLTGLGSNPSINGLNSWPGSASSTQQLADIDDNWVVFTTDANFLDDDGSTTANSGMYYVKSDVCPATPYTQVNNAIRLRQTFQERAGDGVTDNSFIEISLPGYAPTGAVLTPAHTNPY
ncbi:hypothetical protein [Methylophaga pinxianii]|uniref:hypothetical protein n=1 Tax=Methylophaga pinxianii TaxID=2881052 RepID=UPI001CF5F6D4|nr:hypothetical protein [Methylophaga pinxianii]MCB2426944.1 hypothetical protein [Methylophaga pinxianii]UPH44850.1 hypothetical protein LGT42_010030 [Methylophaga pinxianii]